MTATSNGNHPSPMIVGLAHINLIIPEGTLTEANDFYANTLGLTPRAVPQLQKDRLAWFDIGTSGQQVHIALGAKEVDSPRHPCFKIESPEKLMELQQRVYDHYERKDRSAPRAADQPGEANSGAKGVEYPTRFFARDFAGNRLEFSL